MAQALAGFEPKDGDLTPNRGCLGAVVAVSGVYLLGECDQAHVLVGISNFCGHKSLVAELTLRVCLQVVVPLRVFGPP
jgi:hypothetical protein